MAKKKTKAAELKVDWTKFLSREFLFGFLLIVVASVALFKDMIDFDQWTIAATAAGGLGTAGVLLKKKIESPDE